MSDVLTNMTEDVQAEQAILTAKRRIIKILGSLPDDEARRTVIRAANVMMHPPAMKT
jgi:hypothetical protein